MIYKKSSEIIWQDMQHQELFKIFDKLNDAQDKDVLTKLTDYIRIHFSHEEKYMEELHYPKAEEHVKAHKNFESTVNAYIEDQYFFEKDFAQNLSQFLSNWLINHIYTIDKDFEEFVLHSKYK